MGALGRSVPTFPRAGIVALLWQLQPCPGPSSPSRAGSELALPSRFPAEDLRAFYHTWRSAMTPAFQIGPGPYVTQG